LDEFRVGGKDSIQALNDFTELTLLHLRSCNQELDFEIAWPYRKPIVRCVFRVISASSEKCCIN
jgi:hypothetical protein